MGFLKKLFGGTSVPVQPAVSFETMVNEMDGAEMVWVPEGEFIMGSTDEQITAVLKEFATILQDVLKVFLDAEKPQHKVSLDGYWMYKCEVTVAQYRKFCEATKKEMPPAPDWGWIDTHPMVNVDWHDAADYAKWAGVALSTEAQWEKAARGTDGRKYPWGNNWDASKCANGDGTGLKSTKPVGSYPTGVSVYGCMDMSGNVLEWCSDWFDRNYYKNSPTKNPAGPSNGSARVFRGGSWDSANDDSFRCAPRLFNDPSYRRLNLGFRCARTP